MNRFPNLIHRILSLSVLLLAAGSISLYGQSTDTTKIKASHSDTAKVNNTKNRGFLSFIKKIFQAREKKMQQNAVPNGNKLAGSKVSDTTKHGSLKNPSTGSVGQQNTKADSAKKKNVVGANKDSTQQQSPFSRTMKSFISSLDKAVPHGTIDVGYDYGVLPFASDMQVPMGYFHSDGQGQFKLGILPFDGSYCYSNITNISGLNNYFRFSFDAQRFRQQFADKSMSDEELLKSQLGNVYKEKQLAQQKLLYLKSQDGKPTAPNSKMSSENINSNTGSLDKDEKTLETDAEDSLKKDMKKDSAGASKPKGTSAKSDSTALAKNGQKSVTQDTSKAGKSTNNKSEISKCEKEIKRCDSIIGRINKKITSLEKARKNPGEANPNMSKMYNVMSGVKKLDIGLCYPDYSTFMLSGMAVKGINFEYGKNDFYLAATQGTTVNTLLFTNNGLQNHLVNMPNLYNMFDFQSVQSGRKIVDFKTGYGTKEGTHLLVGMLYGSGLPSYLNTFSPGPETGISKNYVIELDGKWAITGNSSINLVYGKSSTQTSGDYFYNSDGGVFKSYQSKAAMGIYKWNIRKTKTKLTLSSRWVDPYFNSFGVSYLRTDNFRYEIKVEQTITSKIKFSIFYRKDADDIVPLYSYHTVLQTVGTNVTLKPLRSLTIRIGYIPVIEHMWDVNPDYNNITHNNIRNILLTYTPPSRGLNTVFNVAYNYYRLTTDTETIAYQNFSLSNQTRFKNSFNNNISLNWFKTSPSDSLNNNVWMFEEEPGYAFHGGASIGIGAKAAWSPLNRLWQFGYEVKIHLPLIKHLSCEVDAEKLVLGDFYNNFNLEEIEKFPYFGQGKIIYSF